MITLGLVDSVDANGVYVTMPGAKGVLRGPYKALSTVAAGTTVLVASTDDGEQVVVAASPGGGGDVSVVSYGARGDGVTDDSAAIQAALNAATSAGLRTMFPPAVYLLGDDLAVPSGATLVGYGATLKMSAGAAHCAITASGAEDVRVSGLTINMNKSAVTEPATAYDHTADGLLFTGGASRVTIQDVTVTDGWQYGVYATASGGSLDTVSLRNVKVSGCNIGAFTNDGDQVEVVGGSCSDNVQSGLGVSGGSGHRIVGVEAAGNGEHGIYTWQYADDFTIQGCRCSGNGGAGILASVGTNRWTITGNTCQGNDWHGIDADPRVSGDPETVVDVFGTIAGNVCSGSGIHGIYVNYGRLITISGNVCEGNAHSGVALSGADIVVSDNMLCNNTVAGIDINFDHVDTSVPLMGSHLIGVNYMSGNGTDIDEDASAEPSQIAVTEAL